MQDLYFDPDVQTEISKHLSGVKGSENKDDARQEAYLALSEECPVNTIEAIQCVRKAIDRFRKRLSRESKTNESLNETSAYSAGKDGYDDLSDWQHTYTTALHKNESDFGSDKTSMVANRIDEELFMNTERPPYVNFKQEYKYSQGIVNRKLSGRVSMQDMKDNAEIAKACAYK